MRRVVILGVVAALQVGCASQVTVRAPATPGGLVAKTDEKSVTQAYITACDRVLCRAVEEASRMNTTAGKKDEMIDACNAVLGVSASPRANRTVVAEYQETTRQWREWCKIRPDWRTLAASVLKGSAAATIDFYGGGGVALSIVAATEVNALREMSKANQQIRDVITRWTRQLAGAGYTSSFWQNAPAEL